MIISGLSDQIHDTTDDCIWRKTGDTRWPYRWQVFNKTFESPKLLFTSELDRVIVNELAGNVAEW